MPVLHWRRSLAGNPCNLRRLQEHHKEHARPVPGLHRGAMEPWPKLQYSTLVLCLCRLMRTQRLTLSLTLHVRTWIAPRHVCVCVTLCVYGPPKNARHATKPLAQPLGPCSKSALGNKRAGQQARWARSALGTPMCELRLTCWRALHEACWSTAKDPKYDRALSSYNCP